MLEQASRSVCDIRGERVPVQQKGSDRSIAVSLVAQCVSPYLGQEEAGGWRGRGREEGGGRRGGSRTDWAREKKKRKEKKDDK